MEAAARAGAPRATGCLPASTAAPQQWCPRSSSSGGDRARSPANLGLLLRPRLRLAPSSATRITGGGLPPVRNRGSRVECAGGRSSAEHVGVSLGMRLPLPCFPSHPSVYSVPLLLGDRGACPREISVAFGRARCGDSRSTASDPLELDTTPPRRVGKIPALLLFLWSRFKMLFISS
jgi:hypothetical protein